MARTYRKPSTNRFMGLSHLKVVRDGTPTKVHPSCENNHGCPYCESNRLHKHNKQLTLKEELWHLEH